MVSKKASKKTAGRKTAARKAAKAAPRKRPRTSAGGGAAQLKELNAFFVKMMKAARKITRATSALAADDPKFAALEAANLEMVNALEDLVTNGPGGPPGADVN
jgi:hypothetical protein